jgi:hypothetical protein
MKKILFFIAMVAITVAMASAQIAVTASGSATTYFGLDLDMMDTGFDVSGEGKISIAPEIDMSSASSAVEDGDTVYGEFTIKNIKLETGDLETKDNDEHKAPLNLIIEGLAAKIVLGDLTLNLWTDPSTKIDYNNKIANAYDYPIFDERYGAGDVSKDNDDDGFEPTAAIYTMLNDEKAGISEYGLDTNAGIQAVYSIPDIMAIELNVKSYDTWAQQGLYNAYAFKAGIDVTAVENLTLAAAAVFSGWDGDSDEFGVGGKAGYSIMLGEEDSITPTVGVMFVNHADSEYSELGISGGVNVSVAGLVLTANMGFVDPSSEVDDDEVWAAQICLDASGLVDGLTAQAAVELDGASDGHLEMGFPIDPYANYTAVHGKVGYAIASGDLTITPGAEVSMIDYAEVDDEEEFYAKVYVTVDGLIDNVQFKLHWDSNDLNENDVDAAVYGPMGQIVLDTKVSL